MSRKKFTFKCPSYLPHNAHAYVICTDALFLFCIRNIPWTCLGFPLSLFRQAMDLASRLLQGKMKNALSARTLCIYVSFSTVLNNTRRGLDIDGAATNANFLRGICWAESFVRCQAVALHILKILWETTYYNIFTKYAVEYRWNWLFAR